MQAIVQERYGGPEVLVSREIDRPGIGDGDVLVRVRAAGLHIGDVFGVRGSTYLMSETAAAIRHIETGHARGKVVVAWPR